MYKHDYFQTSFTKWEGTHWYVLSGSHEMFHYESLTYLFLYLTNYACSSAKCAGTHWEICHKWSILIWFLNFCSSFEIYSTKCTNMFIFKLLSQNVKADVVTLQRMALFTANFTFLQRTQRILNIRSGKTCCTYTFRTVGKLI